jgi:hypothetical protein
MDFQEQCCQIYAVSYQGYPDSYDKICWKSGNQNPPTQLQKLTYSTFINWQTDHEQKSSNKAYWEKNNVKGVQEEKKSSSSEGSNYESHIFSKHKWFYLPYE